MVDGPGPAQGRAYIGDPRETTIMDTLFFHPKLVHIPMALGTLMPLIAGGFLLAWYRKWLPARAWAVAILFQVLLVGSGAVALQTGEADEDRVEEVVSERFIDEHEEVAEAFVWASGAVLGLMLFSLAMARRRAGLPMAIAATLGTLVVFGLGYRTGQAGGALVYEHGAANAYLGESAHMATDDDDDHDHDHDHDHDDDHDHD